MMYNAKLVHSYLYRRIYLSILFYLIILLLKDYKMTYYFIRHFTISSLLKLLFEVDKLKNLVVAEP